MSSEEHKAYLAGGIDVARELLRYCLELRDDYEEKASVARDILKDLYEGKALKSQGSYLLATQAVKYEAQAKAAFEHSDVIEALLERLAGAEVESLVTETPSAPVTDEDGPEIDWASFTASLEADNV